MSSFPRQVTVARVLSSRYQSNQRPFSWDERIEGVDRFVTTDGEELKVFSDGGQSPPQEGWQILLTSLDKTSNCPRWTLFGIPHSV